MHSAMVGGAMPWEPFASTSCNHVMQSCCIAHSVGELRQHFAHYKLFAVRNDKRLQWNIKWNAISKELLGK
jgi:hypothetical protein